MAITTTPAFYYIDRVTSTNNTLDFNEGAADVAATVDSGGYSMEQLVAAAQQAMNNIGSQSYTISLDRATRLVTISAAANFDLLITSGTSTNKIFSLLGFNGADLTGTNTYTGDTAIGSVYTATFPPQNFRGFEDSDELIDAVVNDSTDLKISEVVSFGNISRMSFNLRYITDRTAGKESILGSNPNIVQGTRDLLSFAIKKNRFEFIKDNTDLNTFDTVILDSTPQSRTGTAYRLTEQYDVGLGYYETGLLTFRKVD